MSDWIYDIRTFGAPRDGGCLCTAAIQAAVDAAHACGGGVALVPPGAWVTGTIVLKDNVALHLAEGARLLGSTNIADYPHIESRLDSCIEYAMRHALICAADARHVTIRGEGVIDGRGTAFPGSGHKNRAERPCLLRFVRCEDVRVFDVTLTQPAMYHQLYQACRRLHIRGIHAFGQGQPHNQDALDVDGCQDVRISDCLLESWSDDALVLVSTFPGSPCRDVVVTNCVVSTPYAAIKFGTSSVSACANVTISNCVVRPSGDGRNCAEGISFATVDGGDMNAYKYAIIADIKNPEKSFQVIRQSLSDKWGWNVQPPISIKCKGLFFDWKLTGVNDKAVNNNPNEPGERGETKRKDVQPFLPEKPVPDADGQIRDITLVPYGCTQLRITMFPYTESTANSGK